MSIPLQSALNIVLEVQVQKKLDLLHKRERINMMNSILTPLNINCGQIEGERIPVDRMIPDVKDLPEIFGENYFVFEVDDRLNPIRCPPPNENVCIEALKRLQSRSRFLNLPIPTWHNGDGIEHCSFTGRINLPQERLLLHLGFVTESNCESPNAFKNKWIWKVLHAPNLTPRKWRTLFHGRENSSGEYELTEWFSDSEDEEDDCVWDIDEFINA